MPNCDFCGAPNATRMEIPFPVDADPLAANPNLWYGWGHPLTGNVCRKCLPKQLIKASGGWLVPKAALEMACDKLRSWIGVYEHRRVTTEELMELSLGAVEEEAD